MQAYAASNGSASLWVEEKVVEHEKRITRLEAKVAIAVFIGSALGGFSGDLIKWLLGS